MEKKNKSYLDVAILTIAEAVTAALVVVGFIVADVGFGIGFSYRAVTGALLGAAVAVLNYLFMTLSVNRAVNGYLELRGTKEMTEEEADQFAKENSAPIQNAIKISFLVRTFTMLGTLVLAFLLDWFSPLATAIPLLAFRPLLYLTEFIKGKISK